MEASTARAPAVAGPSARYGLPGCPTCGPVELHPVFDGELTNLYCPLCRSCWHVELGFVARVAPETCPGCKFELQCRETAPHGA